MSSCPAAKSIQPAVTGQSDFFSWQLYRWVKRRPDACEIWRGYWNPVTGLDASRPTLFIGEMMKDGWFHGRRLRSLCVHGGKLESYAHTPSGFGTDKWENISAEWWPEYMRIGICAIHSASHDWLEEGQRRVCKRCGAAQRKRVDFIERICWEAA